MMSHPSDFYWIAFKNRNIPNHPFVSYLNGNGIFTNRPDPEDMEDVGHYWRDVEILGRCEIPDHVQARIDAEFVMYS